MNNYPMKTNTFTFESENLVVDYLTFKFQNLDPNQKNQLVDYLSQIGFNSYQESGKLLKSTKESILLNSRNSFEVCLVEDNSYWSGTLLHFSSISAAHFYFLWKQKFIDWTKFSDSIISRCDIYYSRTNQSTDKISPKEFLENCQRQLKQINKNIILQKNQKGWILKIGNRKSNRFCRIYEANDSLKFEYEIKGRLIHNYHSLLTRNNFEEFEHQISSDFLIHFGKLLPLQYSYLDWLLFKLRPIQTRLVLRDSLNSDYIHSDCQIIMDTKNFINLIQFLNYIKELDYEIGHLESVSYRKVVLKLRDFLRFQDPNSTPTNRYRLAKLRQFLQGLQTGLHVTTFQDRYFQSLVLVPQVRFEVKDKSLLAHVWLVEELFYYSYPFSLPNLFQPNLKKYQFDVRLKVFQIFNSMNIAKEISVKDFLNSYPSTLNNKQKTNIKKDFIEVVTILQSQDCIESNYLVLLNGIYTKTSQLTTSNISQSFIIYEKIFIN